MGKIRDILTAIREYPALKQQNREQADRIQNLQQALKESNKENLSLNEIGMDLSYERNSLQNSVGALKSALRQFHRPVESTQDMEQLYHSIAGYLDPEGNILYETAKKVLSYTDLDIYRAYPEEDNAGVFDRDECDSYAMLGYMERLRFGDYNEDLGDDKLYIDESDSEYQTYLSKLYRCVLGKLGFDELLPLQEAENIQVESLRKRTEPAAAQAVLDSGQETTENLPTEQDTSEAEQAVQGYDAQMKQAPMNIFERIQKMQELWDDANQQIVGYCIWHYNGEIMAFRDSQKYIAMVEKELDYYMQTGFQFETITTDPAVHKAVDDAVCNLFGEENPCDLDYYRQKYGAGHENQTPESTWQAGPKTATSVQPTPEPESVPEDIPEMEM